MSPVDVLRTEPGVSVSARVKEAVFSKKARRFSHFLPPWCCLRYLSSPKTFWQPGQENPTDLEESAGREQFSICLVNPYLLRNKKIQRIYIENPLPLAGPIILETKNYVLKLILPSTLLPTKTSELALDAHST